MHNASLLTRLRARAGGEIPADALEAYRRASLPVLEQLWHYDPDPLATIKVRKEIQDAEVRGFIEEATNKEGRRLGHFTHCPWPTAYEVVRRVRIAGQGLLRGQRFVLVASADGIEVGHPFRRGVHVGEFSAANEFKYGDPFGAPSY